MMTVAQSEARWAGAGAATIGTALGLPRVEVHARLPSTLDRAHELGAAGAVAGTLVIAEMQTAGRGRAGRSWASPAGAGIWLTLVERPGDPDAIQVLSLRSGIRAARALDRFAEQPVELKWPNDLLVRGRKLGGILIEARWRDGRPDWVAIGFGVNVATPAGVQGATGLRTGTDRLEVLAELVPALRSAAAGRGLLGSRELDQFAHRDVARGKRCIEPTDGEVRGITAGGALIVACEGGDATFSAGSLRLVPEP
ncbi:MAG TPA: biotin--[acetyl-CoA-carboxylase] ligase [Gemmatimonadaceae bacterium]|nr:biotin--[acetyl-CoA-carboxylase] ligase [Gemmatimonadaceae bacterium]